VGIGCIREGRLGDATQFRQGSCPVLDPPRRTGTWHPYQKAPKAGGTSSQPAVVAAMLQAAGPAATHRVLEIGAGAALLGHPLVAEDRR
jgi:hypothetical protein